VDVLGHVNNVRYVDYLQDAQTDLAVGVFEEARVKGTFTLAIARTEVDYVGQLNLRPEPYDVWSRVESVGTTSVTYDEEIRDGDRVMARCRIVSVNTDDDDHPAPILPAHRDVFEKRMAEGRVS
jgi:acyl-CoA thioester hydrolase